MDHELQKTDAVAAAAVVAVVVAVVVVRGCGGAASYVVVADEFRASDERSWASSEDG